MNAVVKKIAHIPSRENQLVYFVEVVLPVLDEYLEMLFIRNSLFEALPRTFKHREKKKVIPWKAITAAFDAVSDFEKEIKELQNHDEIASLLDRSEAAPLLKYSEKIRKYKHEIYETIQTAFIKHFNNQVLDNVLKTEYYSMNKLHLTVIDKVSPYFLTGKELFEEFRKDLEESISNQMIQNGILFLVLSEIDKGVKERFLLLHYDNVRICWLNDV